MQRKLWLSLGLALALVAGGGGTALAQDDVEDDLWGPEGGETESGTGTGGELGTGGETTGEEAPAGEAMPNNFAQRGLTLPAGSLRIEANIDIWDFDAGTDDDDIGAGLGTGATIGIIENLEAGLTLLPIVFTPDGGFGDMRLHGTYRFLQTDMFEMGGKIEMLLPTDSTDNPGHDYSISFGLPVLLRFGDLRIDTGFEFAITLRNPPGPNNSDTTFGLTAPAGGINTPPWKRHQVATRSVAGIPAVVNYTIMDSITVGGRLGFGARDFEDFGDTIFMPFGFHGMYTIGGDAGPLADVGTRFRFPYFLASENGFGDVANADIWELTIFGEIYLHELF
ncbi:MAG: hypothetical protein ACOCUS_03155 [Polyangiales bacterium]